jgi:hypothetical protein
LPTENQITQKSPAI